MKKLKFIILFISFAASVNSQTITINGYVTDKQTGEKLIGANIYDNLSKKGTTTNNYGFYSLTINDNDSALLTISYIGYQFENVLIKKGSTQILNFSLIKGQILEEVEVYGKASHSDVHDVEMSIIEIPIGKVKTLPSVGGEIDLMKAMQLMPGVLSGNEGSSALYVRGGSPDQNLILLDDIPLYYLNHLGGFVSVFNVDAINSSKLIKGGYPSSYGSRLSSVFDIRMKEGNLNDFHIQGAIGIISSKISIEGPLKKDTSSYIISIRRFMLDMITKPLLKLQTENFMAGYSFYDINTKVNYKLSDKDRLYLSFFIGHDNISTILKDHNITESENYKDKTNWGNLLCGFRWNHIFSSKLFANTSMAYTQYLYFTDYRSSIISDDITSIYRNIFNSSINDFIFKSDFDFYPSSNYKIKFGTNTIFHNYTPGILSYFQSESGTTTIDTAINKLSYRSYENSIYCENILSISNFLLLNIGVRFSDYFIPDKNNLSIEPRLSTNIFISKNISIKLSYAKMQQYVHLLSFSGTGMPAELWVPATEMSPPEKAYQYTLGIAHDFYKGKLEFTVEAYYKKMTNLIAFSEGFNLINTSQNWQNKVETGGEGESRGIEFLLNKKAGRITGWIGYTLSKTDLVFDNINNGIKFPYRYDRRHDISIVCNYLINENITISATWVYGTGNAITLPIGYIPLTEQAYDPETTNITTNIVGFAEIYDTKNGFRMRDFHKLDIGINLSKQKKWGKRTWSFSIYNAYNRKNPYYYYFDYSVENGITKRHLYQRSLFPIIPSISYSFKF